MVVEAILVVESTRVSQKVMSPVNFNRFNLHIFSRNFKGVILIRVIYKLYIMYSYYSLYYITVLYIF